MRIAAFAIVLAACGSTQRTNDDLMGDVREYQEGLRWRRYEQSAAHMPEKERRDFLDDQMELDDELRIDDYEIQRVELMGGHKAAKVQVKVTWHLDSKGVVHDTVVEETWERPGKSWLIVKQEKKRGEALPVAEKAGTEVPPEPLPY